MKINSLELERTIKSGAHVIATKDGFFLMTDSNLPEEDYISTKDEVTAKQTLDWTDAHAAGGPSRNTRIQEKSNRRHWTTGGHVSTTEDGRPSYDMMLAVQQAIKVNHDYLLSVKRRQEEQENKPKFKTRLQELDKWEYGSAVYMSTSGNWYYRRNWGSKDIYLGSTEEAAEIIESAAL